MPLNCWEKGVAEFNSHRYWHAHEAWEQGWKDLHEPEKSPEKVYVQALIQIAGVFDLVGRGRPEASRRLASLALEKLERGRPPGAPVEIPGAEDFLRSLLPLPDAEIAAWVKTISLEARLLLSPHP